MVQFPMDFQTIKTKLKEQRQVGGAGRGGAGLGCKLAAVDYDAVHGHTDTQTDGSLQTTSNSCSATVRSSMRTPQRYAGHVTSCDIM